MCSVFSLYNICRWPHSLPMPEIYHTLGKVLKQIYVSGREY